MIPRSLRYPSALVIALATVSPLAHAQPRVLSLGTPAAEFSEEFTQIGSLRELADGSLLVADPAEKVLKHVDPRTPRAELLSHVGDGPQEYKGLTRLVGLRGDSTLLYDANGRRWLLFAGARVLGRASADQTAVVALGDVVGSDTLGHVLTMSRLPSTVRPADVGPELVQDSAIMLFTTTAGVAGTPMARLPVDIRVRGRQDTPVNGQLRNSGYEFPHPLSAGTLTALFSDGWLATASSAPYHVDWRRPDGGIVRGLVLPGPRDPVDARQRAFLAGRLPCVAEEAYWSNVPWPPQVPAFVTGPDDRCGSTAAYPVLQPTPDGTLLIRRTDDPATPGAVHYDLIDRTGALVGTLSLPNNQRVIGAGARSIYISVKDDNDILRIRRYAWPLK